MAVMFSKDFNITFIVIEKFKFSQGSLKNACAPDFRGAILSCPEFAVLTQDSKLRTASYKAVS